MIQLKNIQKSFGPLHVLKGIDLNIAEKSVTALIGPSGSGKSTIARRQWPEAYAPAGENRPFARLRQREAGA